MSETLPPEVVQQIADRVADLLLENAFGEKAVRLEMIDSAGKGLGGWGRISIMRAVTLACAPPEPREERPR